MRASTAYRAAALWDSVPSSSSEASRPDQLLRREVDRLPKPFRQVLTLRYFEEQPMEHVAALSGLSLSAAKSMLHRARHELRSRLERHGVL